MTEPALAFHRRIDTALADAGLRQALALTTGRLAGGRTAAFDALPDADACRRRGAPGPRRTPSPRLDSHLDSSRAKPPRGAARSTGPRRPPTRERIISAIARERGIRLAVKSKSMVTEEIELNEALEHAGVRVVETDLGEFVVQLGGDRPSHIITPIVHRSRQDVAALFQEKLGATAGGGRGHPGHDRARAARRSAPSSCRPAWASAASTSPSPSPAASASSPTRGTGG